MHLIYLITSRLCPCHSGTGGQESDFSKAGYIDDPKRHLGPTTLKQLLLVGTNPTWLEPVPGAVNRLMNTEDLAAALEASGQYAPTKKKRT